MKSELGMDNYRVRDFPEVEGWVRPAVWRGATWSIIGVGTWSSRRTRSGGSASAARGWRVKSLWTPNGLTWSNWPNTWKRRRGGTGSENDSAGPSPLSGADPLELPNCTRTPVQATSKGIALGFGIALGWGMRQRPGTRHHPGTPNLRAGPAICLTRPESWVTVIVAAQCHRERERKVTGVTHDSTGMRGLLRTAVEGWAALPTRPNTGSRTGRRTTRKRQAVLDSSPGSISSASISPLQSARSPLPVIQGWERLPPPEGDLHPNDGVWVFGVNCIPFPLPANPCRCSGCQVSAWEFPGARPRRGTDRIRFGVLRLLPAGAGPCPGSLGSSAKPP